MVPPLQGLLEQPPYELNFVFVDFAGSPLPVVDMGVTHSMEEAQAWCYSGLGFRM